MTSSSDQTFWTTTVGTIRKGMTVIGPEGTAIGTVEGLEGEEIMLDHGGFVALTQVDGVSETTVLLSPRGDATFGLGAQP